MNRLPFALNVSPEKYHRASEEAATWVVRLENKSSEVESEFLKWIEASPENQIAYIRAERVWRSSTLIDAVPDGSLFLTWFKSGGLALACCLLVVATLLVGKQKDVVQQETFSTQYGQIQQHELLDGSALIMNANSDATADISSGKRQIYLNKGEVFFDVKRSPEVPFTVTTDTLKVVVLGTQFSVDHSEGRSVVTVLEGRVSVQLSEGEDPQSHILTKNDQVVVSKVKHQVDVIKVDAETSLSWRQKQLVYKGDSLDKVLNDLNRIYKRKFLVEDATLNDLTVVAVIRINTQENTLAKLETLLGLSSKVDSNNDIILFKKSPE